MAAPRRTNTYTLFLIALLSLPHLQPLHGYEKSVTLTTSSPIVDGAFAISYSDTTINPTTNDWWITVGSNYQNWSMAISLDSTWGFHPSLPSTINLTMHGTSPTESGENSLVMSFSVNHAKYWSTILSTQRPQATRDWFNRIGPSCDTKSTPTAWLYDGDVKAIMDNAICCNYREDRCGAWVDTNKYFDPDHEWQPPQNVVNWPLTITIENNPANNEMFVHVLQETYTQSCGFGEAFPSDQGLDVYISGDFEGAVFSFHSFEIQYMDASTESPTQTSKAPTQHPTSAPSNRPSAAPTDSTATASLPPTTNVSTTSVSTTVAVSTSDDGQHSDQDETEDTQQASGESATSGSESTLTFAVIAAVGGGVVVCCCIILCMLTRRNRKKKIDESAPNNEVVSIMANNAEPAAFAQPGVRRAKDAENGDDGVDAIQYWLQNVVKLPEYYALFMQQGIEELESVQDLSKQDLKEMGIAKIGHQNKIMKYARRIGMGEVGEADKVEREEGAGDVEDSNGSGLYEMTTTGGTTTGGRNDDRAEV